MSTRLDVVDGRCVTFTRRIAFLGVLGMLAIAILTIVDVSARLAANAPIPGFTEFIEMFLAVAIAATFPAGLAQRVNLSIDLFEKQLGAVLVRWLKVFGGLFLLVMFFFLAWRIGVIAYDLQRRGMVTIVWGWPRGPFIWTVAGLMAICVPVQIVAFLASLRDAMGGVTRPTGGAFSADGQAPTVAQGRAVSAKSLTALAVVLLVLTVIAVLWIGQGIEAVSEIARAMPGTVAAVLFLFMWVLLLLMVPLGPAMALIGLVGAALLIGFDPAVHILGSEATDFLTNHQIAVLPLFLMMGSFAAVSGLSSDIYRLAHAVVGHLRGGLALATIGGCAGFGALTGSSLATAATIGRIALPEMRARGYAPGLATGCVAAGGTLGQLVPPSTVIVLYAILVEESIGRLFIAAIVPAGIAVVFYMITISIYTRFVPGAAPSGGQVDGREIIAAIRQSWGALLLFGMVIGGIYGGVFTATEAAAVGAGGAFLFALFRGKLAGGAFWKVMGETTATTAMIYTLIFGAITFSFFLGVTGLTTLVSTFIAELDLAPLGIIALLLIVYLLLGAIMDPFAILIITVPILSPVVVDLGFDLVWWGIIMVIVVETGLITPPFGINVFVIKGVAPDVPLGTVFRGVMPFVAADIVKLALLVLFPGLVLWLPATMMN